MRFRYISDGAGKIATFLKAGVTGIGLHSFRGKWFWKYVVFQSAKYGSRRLFIAASLFMNSCVASLTNTTMSTTSKSLTKPVYFEYRCGRCWNSNCVEANKTGQSVPCNVCGAENVVPEATIDRIERAEAMISESLHSLSSSLDQGNANSVKRPEDFYRVPTEEELIAEARAACWVPLHQRDFRGYPNASTIARIFARFADELLSISTLLLGFIACMWMAKQGWVENPVQQFESKEYVDWNILILMGTPFCFLQAFQSVLLSKQGQTIGKYLLGIRIVSVSGRVSGFLQAVLARYWICTVIGHFIPFYYLINFVLLFTYSKRCLHDYISGTRVVSS